MAKKKRRSGSSARGGRPTGRDVATATDTPPVRPAPSRPGGPNRLERKEEARRQREAIRRRMARRRMLRRLAWVLGILVVVAAVAYFAVSSGKSSPLNAEEQSLLDQAPQAATASGCSAVQTVKPYSPENQDRVHIGTSGAPATMPPLSSYSSVPPASGPHNNVTLGAGVYQDPPPVDQAIHSLEHAAAIVWYDPNTISPDDLTKLQTFFEKPGEDTKVIVAPYNYPDQGDAGKLPEGKQMALVAWHRMQTCDKLSLPVAYQFVHFYANAPKSEYRGDAPEPSVGI